MVKTWAPIPLSFAALVGWSGWMVGGGWQQVAGGKKGSLGRHISENLSMTTLKCEQHMEEINFWKMKQHEERYSTRVSKMIVVSKFSRLTLRFRDHYIVWIYCSPSSYREQLGKEVGDTGWYQIVKGFKR